MWRIWTNVADWPRWDTALVSASLDGPFILHGCGRLVSRGGPPSPFVITQIDPGQSYTFTTRLPLAQLNVRRTLAETSAGTQFTHDVSFTGPLGWMFGLILGRRFRAMLPSVMERIRQIAEQEQ